MEVADKVRAVSCQAIEIIKSFQTKTWRLNIFTKFYKQTKLKNQSKKSGE